MRLIKILVLTLTALAIFSRKDWPFEVYAQAAKTLQLGTFMPLVILGRGYETIQSQLLREIFNEAAAKACVPRGLIYAISKREAGRTWGYSDDEVRFYSTPSWWEGTGINLICNGYAYDTCRPSFCARVVPPCAPQANVMGPMQFEARIFEGYRVFVEPILGRPADRRNLKDAILAAAFKIKANSGTEPGQCQGWDEATVRQVAQGYCGACGGPACGYNYCDDVYLRYLQYSAKEP